MTTENTVYLSLSNKTLVGKIKYSKPMIPTYNIKKPNGSLGLDNFQ